MCKGGGRVGSGKDDEAVQRARTPCPLYASVGGGRDAPNFLSTTSNDTKSLTDPPPRRRDPASASPQIPPKRSPSFPISQYQSLPTPQPAQSIPGPSIAPHHRIEHPRPARRKRHAGPQERRLRRKIRPGRRRCCSLGRDPSYRDARPSGPFIGSVPISRRPDVAA